MNIDSGHLQRLLDEDCTHRSTDSDLTKFRKEALKKSFRKKFVESNQRNVDLHVKALQDFAALNTVVSNYTPSDSFLSDPIVRTWKSLLEKVFNSGDLQMPILTLDSCLQAGSCGPGASIDAADNSFQTKMFESSLSTTDLSLYARYVKTISRRWVAADSHRFETFGVNVVAGGRISSVSKDGDKNRTIEIQPVLNMFYQLGAKTVLTRALREVLHLDLSLQQELNKSLARSASIDGSLSTIDLKNASDCNTVALCGALLPANAFEVLMKIRTPVADMGDGVFAPLYMISTMGNGFTFALMTIMFATLVQAIYIHSGETYIMGKTCAVYGDDIIISTNSTGTLLRLLQGAGFTVNTDKSFTEGPFRESCGGDYYEGHDVRGIYMKVLTCEAHIYSIFNRLHFWSIRNNISLHRTLVYLKGLAKFQPVPGHAGVHEGFIVTRSELLSPKYSSTGSIYYRSTQPKSYGRAAGSFTNHQGLLISFLGGYVRNNQVAMRSNAQSFRVVKKHTPCWDYVIHPEIFSQALSDSWLWLLSHD